MKTFILKTVSTEFATTVSALVLIYLFPEFFKSGFELSASIVSVVSVFCYARALHKMDLPSRAYTAYITREFYVLVGGVLLCLHFFQLGKVSSYELSISLVILQCAWTITRGITKKNGRLRPNVF